MSLLSVEQVSHFFQAFKYHYQTWERQAFAVSALRGTKDAVNCEPAGQHWCKEYLNRQFIQYAYNNRLYTYTGLLVRTSTHCKCTGDLGFGRRRSKYINGEWWLNKSAILCTGSCHFHRWNPGWRSGIWIVRSVKHRAPSTLCTVFCITVISWLLQRSESTELLF